MGPRVRYLGKLVPAEAMIWQDPVPTLDHTLIDATDIAALKTQLLASGLSTAQLVTTAWASAAELLVDRANLLTLTAPEMTVLIGGLRVLGATVEGAAPGVFTRRPGVLSNDFFVNLLDMRTTWQKSAAAPRVMEGRDRSSGALKWTATAVDLIFGSNSQLRALAEVHASADAQPAFVRAFVAAWARVMQLDRFDLA